MPYDKAVILGEGTDEDPAILLSAPEVHVEIEDTTLGDRDAPKRQLIQAIAKTHEDWGDGFFVQPEPVLVQRDKWGKIVRTTPLSEIEGVEVDPVEFDKDIDPVMAEANPTVVPMTRQQRGKLHAIIAHRLFYYYKDRGPADPRYNPFRDGLADLPAGSPEHLQPLPSTQLYPATETQIYDWLLKFVADRTSVIDKRRFGGGHLQDLALRIE